MNLTCQTCDGNGTYYNPAPPGLGEPMPCPDCVEGIPRTLIETLAPFIDVDPAIEPNEWYLARRHNTVRALKALRDREEPRE